MAKQATRAPDRYANRNAPPPIGHGWVAFAGSYLVLAGLLNLIWGITALSKKDYFHESGLLWTSLDTWGGLAVILMISRIQTVEGVFVDGRVVPVAACPCNRVNDRATWECPMKQTRWVCASRHSSACRGESTYSQIGSRGLA